MTTGIKICFTSSHTVLNSSKLACSALRKSPIHNGVITIPIILEILALNIAAGRLPPAIDTITTEEETVEGRAAK